MLFYAIRVWLVCVQGKSYVNRKNKVVPPRKFTAITACCKRNCCVKIPATQQRIVYMSFWSIGDYEAQNRQLAGLMSNIGTRSRLIAPRRRNRRARWKYTFNICGTLIVVCQKFFHRVLKIPTKRSFTLQMKILDSVPLASQRGKHKNRPHRIDSGVWVLLKLFCASLPHRESHYSNLKTRRMYFTNPMLNLEILFELFTDYYSAITGGDLMVNFNTFVRYFNRNLNFSFRLPRTDVCNMCYQKEQQGLLDKAEETQLRLHKMKAAAHAKMKNTFIANASDAECLVVEFDYAQNLPLPRIPVNDQFYKRLLWFFVFNAHLHGSEKSYMFTFLEGSSKKGANSVCSFLHQVLLAEIQRETKTIFMLSDACPGQNRNYTICNFLCAMAVLNNIEILQLYPVRGHSYSQCDRNFSVYSRKVKKSQSVETPQEYIDIIAASRSPPFTMRGKDGQVMDFEAALRPYFKKPKNFEISKASILIYHANGTIEVHKNYSLINGTVFNPLKNAKLPRNIFDDLQVEVAKGVAELKKRDVLSLLPYIKRCNQKFYTKHLSKITDTSDSDASASDDSDLEY